jgi:cysteine desulfurase/selenocysteine lyase
VQSSISIVRPYTTEFRTHFPQLSALTGVYLDSAATSLKPSSVIRAVEYFLQSSVANVYRSGHSLGVQATTAIESARAAIASSINASACECIFTCNASQGLDLVAEVLRPLARRVYVGSWEHQSNVLPWIQRYPTSSIECNAEGAIDLGCEAIKSLRPGTAVSVAHVSNVLGVIQPISELADICHTAGTVLVVDGTQAYPHLRVDVKALDADAYVFSLHKAFGPSGVAVVYLRQDLMSRLLAHASRSRAARQSPPYFAYSETDYPYCFERGTPNIEGIIASTAAVDFRARMDIDALAAGAQSIRGEWLHVASSFKHFIPVGGFGNSSHISLLTFACDGIDARAVEALLSEHYGIHARGGVHCALPLDGGRGFRGGLRFSAYAYNTEDECRQAIIALAALDSM